MDIKKLQKSWDEFGKVDPLWAILTLPDKKGNKWEIDEFWLQGKTEIEEVIKSVQDLSINLSYKKALDFGCGVGRLTQALANYFDEAWGVDIAPSMIELANKYNSHGSKCRYYLNETNDLKLFEDGTFDFIYSNITLQHMKPEYSQNYIKEFLRILAPKGLLVFQIPSHRKNNVKLIDRLRELLSQVELYRQIKYGTKAKMEMHGINHEKVIKLIEDNGGSFLSFKRDEKQLYQWISYQYFVAKKR